MDLPLLLSELRRRRVGRVIVAYGVIAFAVLQVIEPVQHGFHWPDWVLSAAVTALALGFPVAVALAWVFDLGPGGIERTAPLVAAPVTVAAGALPSVAVLPFDDLSAARDQGWFCDGIAEELLGALCCVSGLRVVSRSSSFQFKGKAVDAREVGQALGAGTLLEGSVRRAGSRVRVAARLVDARQGLELWSEQFDRELADTFAVQEEIAQAVVRAMELRLTSGEQARLRQVGASRGTRDARAYELYLRGRHALMRHGERWVLEARDAFREAIVLDPAFAQAQAGLADADFIFLTWALDISRAEDLTREAQVASEAALRLAPDLAEARLARANVLTLLGRWPEAEAEYRRAIDLNPGWGDACYFYARGLFSAHRFAEAAAAWEESVRRNPDDYAALALLEGVYRRIGDAAGVASAGRRGLEAVARRLALDPDDVRALYLGAGLDLRHGDRDRAFQRIARSLAIQPDDFATHYNAACFYALAGEAEPALAALDRAVADGRGQRRWMEQDADLDLLRSDPRFDAIMARVKG